MNSLFLTIQLSLRSILGSKMRSFLTMLGVIIGIASVISIVSLGAGAQSLITNSLKNLGTNTLSVLPGNSDDSGPPAAAMGIEVRTLVEADAEAILKLPHVSSVIPHKEGGAELSYFSRYTSSNFSGVTANYSIEEEHAVSEGRFFTDAEERSGKNVVVLGASVRELLFPLSSPLGESIKIKGQSFEVIGVLERKGSQLFADPDDRVYVPLSAAQNKLAGEAFLSFIRIRATDETFVDELQPAVENLLRLRHNVRDPANDDFSVRTVAQALNVFTGVTNALRFFLAAIAAVSLLVGGISITNVMLMTVKERTREVGLKKALGATPTMIRDQFLVESAVLTSIGGIFGILTGAGFSFLVALILWSLDYTWDFSVSLTSIVVAWVVSAAIGIGFGVYPAQEAARLNPIDALRYE